MRQHSLQFGFCGLFVCLLQLSATAENQTYDLVVPGTPTRSSATFVDGNLRIVDAAGVETVYQRDPSIDSADYMGFTNSQVAQSIQFPLAGKGPLQIGNRGPFGVRFRTSQMVVVAVDFPTNTNPVQADVTNLGVQTPLLGETFVLQSALDPALVLAANPRPGGNVYLARANAPNTEFRLMKLSNGYVSIAPAQNTGLAIGMGPLVFGRRALVSIYDRRQTPAEQTQFRMINAAPGYVAFANRGVSDYVLDVDDAEDQPMANVSALVYSGLEHQLFRLVKKSSLPSEATLPFAIPPEPARVLISKNVVPNERLAAAQVDLFNSHGNELWVLLTDLVEPAGTRRIKIPPGQTVSVTLQRDVGAKAVSVFDVTLPDGSVVREESVAELPGRPRYDISVYELAPTSVYIDATQSDAKPEISRTPRSVGFFVVPALVQSGKSDIFQVADRQRNTGAVRRIDPRLWGAETEETYKNAFDRLIDGQTR